MTILLRVVVNDLTVWFVKTSSQVFLSKGQTNSICNSLSKRTCKPLGNRIKLYSKPILLNSLKEGSTEFQCKNPTSCDLNTRSLKVLWMSRGSAFPLTEALQIFLLISNSSDRSIHLVKPETKLNSKRISRCPLPQNHSR